MSIMSDRIPVADALRLEVKKAPGGSKTPVLCLPGLTRNAADFDDVLTEVAGTERDVYALSFRGRGRSDRDPQPARYQPATYAADVVAAMDALDMPRAVFIGTSLGGLVTALVNEAAPDRVVAAVINDIGPRFAAEGIARIIAYVTDADARGAFEPAPFETAIARIKAINGVAFPDADAAFWETFARRTYDEGPDGWTPAYDSAIADAFGQEQAPIDIAGAFAALAGTPTLLVHGAISDLLDDEIVAEMRAVDPAMRYCRVENVGHAPTLSEPAAREPIAAFVREVAPD
ncbi:MAG: alpha/beta hydrolase [Pseudomonadota bacterium]